MSAVAIEPAPALPAAANPSASARDWTAVIAGVLGGFMAALDISITNASLPQIQGEIGATGTEGTWITTAYLVAETVMIPLTAWLVRIFGLRRLLLICSILFTLFSLVCGFAGSLPQMIVGRLGQGFFGGALIPTALTIVALKLPAHQQGTGMTLFGMTLVFGPILGPVLGGWLTENMGWYWVFFLNLPIGIMLVVMILIGFDPERSRFDALVSADWLGIVGISLLLGALTVVLEEGQREQWFESAEIVRLGLLGGVGLVLFVISQCTCPDPVLKLRLLRDRGFSGAMIVALMMGGGYFAILYLLPVFLAEIGGYSASQIGTIVMYSGAGSLLAIASYPMLSKHIDLRLIIAFGLSLIAASCWMDVAMTVDSGGSHFLVSQIVCGIGMSLLFFPLNQLAMAGIATVDVPDASGLFNMARNLGGSIGVAVTAIVIDTRLAFHKQMIAEGMTANSAIAGERVRLLSTGLGGYGADPLRASDQALHVLAGNIIRQALVMSYADCFWVIAVGCVIVSPALLLLRGSAGGTAMAAH